MSPRLIPVSHSDYPLLFEIYVSSRAEEMKLAPWTDEQKHAFLESQFEAQDNHYHSIYPNASYDLIKLEDQTAGRLYQAELDDEIRILDITVLPQFQNRGIGTFLLSEISATLAKTNKSRSGFILKLITRRKLYLRGSDLRRLPTTVFIVCGKKRRKKKSEQAKGWKFQQ